MGFEVVSQYSRPLWVPIVDSDTIYVGQIVASQTNEGIVPIGAAAGANDLTNKSVPMGVVIAVNADAPAYDSTYMAEYITDATPHGTTVQYALQDGVWAKGDKMAMAQIVPIDPTTLIKGRLFNGTYGAAMTVGTVTSGSASGITATVNTLEASGVANMGTVYFRTGANAGAYRVTDDTSPTVIAWDKPTVNDVAIGDTLVRAASLRPFGLGRCQFDTEGTFIDVAAACTSNYYGIHVYVLDLSQAGKEFVIFRFDADHFCSVRAAA